MSKFNKKTSIDYLFEDPPIQNQQFALVSIVGPNMNQKCDIWGLKVRGTAESLDRAKALSQKILQVDNHYDIYTVEVGKFFPLAVEPTEINNVEYQNEQLNQLMKNYLQNKESASDFWHKRKNEMIQDAIKEGKSQSELANRPEHPVAVLQRINNYDQTLKEMQENISELEEQLKESRDKFYNYTEEERNIAYKEIEKDSNNNLTQLPSIQEIDENTETIEDIRKQILDDNNNIHDDDNLESINDIMNKITNLEIEIPEMTSLKNNLSSSSLSYKRIEETISNSQKELQMLKDKLNNKDLVNDYINENYPNPQSYNF
jgi:DNA repair exonuclease SbcCD ATPase subunit